MKLKVKDMDIATGGVLVAILSEDTAHTMDLFPEDRIKIKKGNKVATAVIDIAESEKAVPKGSIGLFEEVLDELNAVEGDDVIIELQEKPRSIYAIKKKLDGHALTKDEIDLIVKDIVTNQLTDIELAYFIGACYTNKMNMSETVSLTRAIVNNGGQLKLKDKIVVDKHCSGGVPGNRTTMLVVPIIAAAGFKVPKTSSRSITSPSGTADTMEVLAPVSLTLDKVRKVVNKVGACIIWGGAVDLAAADDKLIRVRHSLSLDPEGMLLSSILAKKAAVNSNVVLIDIPVGKDTKIKTKKQANHLKHEFVKIGKSLGMKIKVVTTDGNQPIGWGIGPVLEAKDILYVLRRDERRPMDLETKALKMASMILAMVGVKNPAERAKYILESGEAYRKMREIIEAQGGNPDIAPEDIAVGEFSYTYKAPKSGVIFDIDNFSINKVARIAGAPRDKESGILLYKHEKQKVIKGEQIFTIYAKNSVKLQYAKRLLKQLSCIVIK